MRVFGVVRLADRHLEDPPVRDGDRVIAGRRAAARLRTPGDAPEDAGNRFKPETGGGGGIVFVRPRRGLSAFDEILVGHRLVERDELDPPRREEPLVGLYQGLAILGHGLSA